MRSLTASVESLHGEIRELKVQVQASAAAARWLASVLIVSIVLSLIGGAWWAATITAEVATIERGWKDLEGTNAATLHQSIRVEAEMNDLRGAFSAIEKKLNTLLNPPVTK